MVEISHRVDNRELAVRAASEAEIGRTMVQFPAALTPLTRKIGQWRFWVFER